MKVLVIGSGAVAQTLAFHLAEVGGHQITLGEIPGFAGSMAAIAKAKGIEAQGFFSGFAPVQVVDNWASAITEHQTILVAVVAEAHQTIAKLIAPYIEEEHRIIYYPGNLGGQYLLAECRRLERQSPQVIEANTVPYGCRVTEAGGNKVGVKILTPAVLYGCQDADLGDLNDILEILSPKAVFGGTPESVILSNPNPLFHTLPCLLNAGYIEGHGSEFYMYNDGITPSIYHALQRKDAERSAILQRVAGKGLTWSDLRGIIKVDGAEQELHFLECGKAARFLGPTHLKHRYVVEDTVAGLVCWERLGQMHGVPTPIVTSEIELISMLLEQNFREIGQDRANLLS